MGSSQHDPEILISHFLQALRAVASGNRGGLHDPEFGGNEKTYLAECIDTGFVSSVGPFVSRFEEELARYVGSSHAIAVVNGTSALHLGLVGLGVMPGDEVIVPALSFVATASAVALAGATPHFVDVSEETWGVSPDSLRKHLSTSLRREGARYVNKDTGNPVTAVVPMHTLGHPFDGEGIRTVANEFGLAFLEDAAESLGSFRGEIHTGLAGDAGIFSFNGNKTITTGGGGVIVTNNSDLATKLRHLATTAKTQHRFEFGHDAVGFNYRMPNINAALGVAQLEQLPSFVSRQRSLFEKYSRAFASLDFGTLKSETLGTQSNFWLQAFLLNKNYSKHRDDILHASLDSGIPVRPLWKPLNTLPPYRNFPSASTPITTLLYERVICLPSSPALA
jgi:aminotransferase in exopolysaccharide biosynthesis